jgi:small-conductance mechanosensitive channel
MGKRLISFAAAIAAVVLLLPSVFVGTTSDRSAAPEAAPATSAEASTTSQAAVLADPVPRTAGNVAYAQETEPAEGQGTAEATAEEPSGEDEPGIVEERTPVPTATPGVIEENVAEFAESTGIYRVDFLGLNGEEWINLVVSILIVAGAYALASWLLWGPIRHLVRRSPSELDDQALTAVGPHLRWLIVIFCLSFATERLGFVSAELKQVLRDFYFLTGGILVVVIGFRLINLGFEQYREHVVPEEDRERLEPLLTLLRRMAIVVLAMTGAIVILSYFGVNVTALTASLGIVGLALSLAAQDTLSDAIAGFIILMDQPFRVGDRIQITDENTWGDVVEIGTRTTRIRTRDNRMVIVPNSTIGTSQVVNYTFPDPEYRVETHVGIGYGTDIERARNIIIDTVRQVPGILPDRSVDALYNEMGDSSMIFRVRWWIESYEDTRRIYDRVHTALQKALDAAEIDMPFPTENINVRVAAGETDQVSGALGPVLPAR